ncbi:MAG TPA: carbohydrate kinase [Pilimelia sp.]|nr:carbohydrate kinase [Pilimelia sp.]
MSYAVILGEALIDLLDGECGGDRVYRQVIGGAPLNVAVGVARLGEDVEFAGSVGDDRLGERIARFLTDAGVGTRNLIRVQAPTTLAVAVFDGAEPEFRFYGDPPSYGAFRPDDLDEAMVAEAGVLYCGSIGLLSPHLRAAARSAWATAGPLRAFDPNVRPSLLTDQAALADQRALAEEFAATADLVKLSAADAQVLYEGVTPAEAARRLATVGGGHRTVVVTRGPHGALVFSGGEIAELAAPAVRAVDATGAGDSVMAALIAQVLATGPPADLAGWREYVDFALRVAGLVCESPGGAVSMPTRAQVARRYASPPS